MLQSPCINICKMDATSGLCTGCFRTLDEITLWSRTDDATRAGILAAVARRRLEQPPTAGEVRGDGKR
ncbi:DUF1289 domain-containing protein [Dechloromonas hortensis]|uniref:DUF1289 domain-containing protein n=1 Tax=Dechloromonas hortensis TaxID=337779 RepID=UPI001291B268|nr:DUF1289 domain-containing protein [Dechloromonas hortensis]